MGIDVFLFVFILGGGWGVGRGAEGDVWGLWFLHKAGTWRIYHVSQFVSGLPLQQTTSGMDAGPRLACGTVCEVGHHSTPADHLLDVGLHVPNRFPDRCAADMRTAKQHLR